VALRNAHLNASGVGGGGTVLVGAGGVGGSGDLMPARNTLVDAASTIRADATARGAGGSVVVWSEQSTSVAGTITARGGPGGGDGGFVETSGRQQLAVSRAPDASASRGNSGLWLLDPYNLTIQAGGPDSNVSGLPAGGSSSGTGAVVAAETIANALNAGTDVSISTGAGGSEDGDITLAASIIRSTAGQANLTLNAHRNIYLDANVLSQLGTLNLVLNPDSDGDASGATLQSPASTISLNGGTATFSGATTLAGSIAGSRIRKTNGEEINLNGATFSGVIIDTDLTTLGSLYIENGLSLLAGKTVTIKGEWLLRGGEQLLARAEQLDLASTVWWDVIGRDLRISQPRFTAVSAGSFQQNDAVVAPGSGLNLAFDWSFGGGSSNYDYCSGCVIQNYIAWIQPSQASNSSAGLRSDALWSDSVAASGSFEWSTTAPTTAGTYFIGSAAGLDFQFYPNRQGEAGGLSSSGPYGSVAPFRVTVRDPVGRPSLNLQGGSIQAASGAAAVSLRLGEGLSLGGAGSLAVPEIKNQGEIQLSDSLAITADQLLNQGLITGRGSIDLGTGTLTNSGTITAGSADQSGTISITGNLALAASSRLQLNLRGNDSHSSANDQLLVSGAASLDGQLEISPSSSYTPSSGTMADILTAASISGDFNGTSLPSGFSRGILAAQNGSPASLTICPGFCWDGGGGADTRWSTAANWFLDSVPGGGGNGDIIYFKIDGGAIITLDDSRSVEALFSGAGNALRISDQGSLTLAGQNQASQLGGSLTLVNGGTLVIEGLGSTISGGFQQQTGNLTGSGKLTLTGLDNIWRGGSWSGSGTTQLASGAQLLVGAPAASTARPSLQGRTVTLLGGSDLTIDGYLYATGNNNSLSINSDAILRFGRDLNAAPEQYGYT